VEFLLGFLGPRRRELRHVILWSTASRWLDRVDLVPLRSGRDLLEYQERKSGAPLKRTVVVRARWYRLPNREAVLIAFIPAAQTPLAKLSHLQKAETGKRY